MVRELTTKLFPEPLAGVGFFIQLIGPVACLNSSNTSTVTRVFF